MTLEEARNFENVFTRSWRRTCRKFSLPVFEGNELFGYTEPGESIVHMLTPVERVAYLIRTEGTRG